MGGLVIRANGRVWLWLVLGAVLAGFVLTSGPFTRMQSQLSVMVDSTHQVMCWSVPWHAGLSCLPLQFVSGPH